MGLFWIFGKYNWPLVHVVFFESHGWDGILPVEHLLGTNETEQDPAGPSWVQKPLHVPRFLFVENF